MQQSLRIKNHLIGSGTPIICVPIMAHTKEQIVSEAARLIEEGVQMIEWRLDAFEALADRNAIRGVFAALSPLMLDTILVYTFRSRQQGGLAQLTEEQTQDVYQVAAECGVADFVDVEYFAQRRPQRVVSHLQSMGMHVIASHHDFAETPSEDVMRMLAEQMMASGADIIKMAVMPHESADVLSLLSVTDRFHKQYPTVPLITISMGPLGCISRMAGEVFGSCVTFAAAGEASAPGQLPLEELSASLNMLHAAGEEGKS